jgi:Skp family chaperone for outer membrane proteins
MNHPTPEEWGMYLFDEASPELHEKLQSHLSRCQDCAAEVQALQQTMGRLDAWKIEPALRRSRLATPIFKLAIAALFVLGIGIGLGRFTVPSIDVDRLRSEIQASAQRDSARALDQTAAEYNALLAATETRMLNRMEAAMQALGRDLIDSVEDRRLEDRRAVQVAIEKLKQQRDVDYVSLRRDLETVASAADQQLQQARLKLIELAANSPD